MKTEPRRRSRKRRGKSGHNPEGSLGITRMVRTEKRPQEARRQVRHAREAAAEGGEASQGTTRKAAAEGSRREGPGTVQPWKARLIGEEHPKGLPVGADGQEQAGTQRRDEQTKRKDITRTSEGTERENACEGTKVLSHMKEKSTRIDSLSFAKLNTFYIGATRRCFKIRP